MLAMKPNEEKIDENWVRKTSRKIIAVGAGLLTFLRLVDKINFSPTPSHKPDPKLINQIVELLEPTK
jgi:hypothetical protein